MVFRIFISCPIKIKSIQQLTVIHLMKQNIISDSHFIVKASYVLGPIF